MPVKVPNSPPVIAALRNEGVAVINESTAIRQDIRPLRFGLLNLMPDKVAAEIQFSRLIGATPLQTELTLVSIPYYKPKHAPPEYMEAFYRSWDTVSKQKFDGFIITGAPVEHLPFEDVLYWPEIVSIFEWTRSHVHSTLAVCWGAQAMCYHFYKIPKLLLDTKAFGCYSHTVPENMRFSPYIRGFSDSTSIPVSRWSACSTEVVKKCSDLDVLLYDSQRNDAGLLVDQKHRSLYMFNHVEYDTHTLQREYLRDIALGKTPSRPENYFADNSVDDIPVNSWRSNAHLFFANWINEIYQRTPFNIDDIGII
jgi:homoserine O-succinyltransferase